MLLVKSEADDGGRMEVEWKVQDSGADCTPFLVACWNIVANFSLYITTPTTRQLSTDFHVPVQAMSDALSFACVAAVMKFSCMFPCT